MEVITFYKENLIIVHERGGTEEKPDTGRPFKMLLAQRALWPCGGSKKNRIEK